MADVRPPGDPFSALRGPPSIPESAATLAMATAVELGRDTAGH
jgi:hypothetical protein